MKTTFCRKTQRLNLVSSLIPNAESSRARLEASCRINVRSCNAHGSYIRVFRTWLPLTLCLATASVSWAASAPQDMREITSELIYNFALLSQTPNRTLQDAYNICAFEEDIGYLQSSTLQSQKLQNLQVSLLPLKTIAEVKRCNLLYIQDFVVQKPLEFQQSIQKDVVLTVVHNGNKFADYGHVVISAQDKRYQFDLRIQPAKQAGIVFDARLLKLATNIIND
jgi:hypothetical protein